MVSLNVLKGRVVAIDTAPFIYLIEEHPVFGEAVVRLFESLDRGEFRAVTSTITLLEVLVQPLRKSQQLIADRYRSILLNARNISIVPVLAEVAEQAARLRAAQGYTTPDALQLATAAVSGATIFVTNDAAFRSSGELEVVLVSDLASST